MIENLSKNLVFVLIFAGIIFLFILLGRVSAFYLTFLILRIFKNGGKFLEKLGQIQLG